MSEDPALRAADRLRSCLVAGMGFALGGLFWLAWAEERAEVQGAVAPAVFWIGLALSVMGWGLWRYLVRPLRALVAVRGPAATARLVARVAVVCLPYGVICGVMLAPLGADVPIAVQAMILLALIWGWDWMKARSQPGLAAAVPELSRAVP
ncbi:hypothetical protein [Seohaeicola zhoushanensis]|uniref:Uncharacterized protein n=1 Tax=Seohaeicola zhoushanensis TaxID=1569283 RepID=A0A8J3GY83_9RHOB|nr:hypothetical protein [Seohaeicola zhoushanensis]GHF50116.1 hypothetical protein GCM10017056_22240 [Seohaeicola zhoushanensis]